MKKSKLNLNHRVLDRTVAAIVEAVKRTGADVRGPVPMPTKIKRYTVLKSPHINKDSREQFEMKIHARMLDIVHLFPVRALEKFGVFQTAAGGRRLGSRRGPHRDPRIPAEQTVAAGVDEESGADRELAGFVEADDRFDPFAVFGHERRKITRMEHDRQIFLGGDPFVQFDGELVGIETRPAGKFAATRSAALQPFEHFGGQPADDLPRFPGIVKRVPDADEILRGDAAEQTGLLQQTYRFTETRRPDRGEHAGTAAADHAHIDAPYDRNFLGRYDDHGRIIVFHVTPPNNVIYRRTA